MKQAVFAAAMIATLVPRAGYATPVLDPENGHYYEVGTSAAGTPASVTFDDAFALAQAHSYDGMQGYLATITSLDEWDFVTGLTTSTAWLGGSDAAEEGTWRWIDGPEAGQLFYTGAAPTGVCQIYCDWSPGEPNNAGSENALVMNWNTAQQWNDWSGNDAVAYIVEYSASSPTPELATWAMMLIGFGATGALLRLRRAARRPA